MASVNPTTTIGGVGVIPIGHMPLAVNGSGYVGTGAVLSASSLRTSTPESLKRHVFYFDSVANTNTFDSGSTPKCPTGVVQAVWIPDNSDFDCNNVRVTGNQSILFTASGTDNGWLVVYTRY